MKQFFGAFFGSIIGLVVATVLGVLIVVAVVKSSVGSVLDDDKENTVVKENSVLKLVVNGELRDRERENPFEAFGGGGGGNGPADLGLNELAKKLAYAKTDDKIKGVFLCMKQMQGGFAGTRELREMLGDFKKSGKFVYCYADYYSQQEYYLASVADKVFLNPQGAIEWKGLYMGVLFFKKTLEKLDVEVQVFRHGKFKSAVEPFILDKMSQSNRFQSEIFLGGIWKSMVGDVSASRHITPEELNSMANTLQVESPQDAVDKKLVDALAYEDEVLSELKKKTGLKEADKVHFASMDKYTPKTKIDSKASATRIAVIYAEGSINVGEGDDDQVGSDRLARAIREARLDDKVKAIVLRVNSPGGSALASDVIWREMTLAKKAKPTVVSMGDVAASGGYYISCAADRIYAQPNTITGSIGVFGLIPNLQKMLENKLGITVDTVNTNKYSDFGNGLRPVTDYEYQMIQKSVERVYSNFTGIVAKGRKMSQADVDSIGQGRVWSGVDALRIGLVDELGGLDDAIEYAAKKAGIKDYRLMEMPKLKSPFDEFFGNKEAEMEARILKNNLGSAYTYLKYLRHIQDMKGIQARMPFEMVFE